MRRGLLNGAATVALVLLLAAPAPAAPAVVPPERFDGYTLRYLISWNGIPAARAEARLHSDVGRTGLRHGLDVRSWTLPILRLIWPAENTIHSVVRGDLAPLTFSIFRRERWEEQSAEITFDHDAGEVHVIRRKPSGRVKEVTRPIDGLYDPLSLLYNLRESKTELGTAHEARVVVSDDVYRLSVEVVEHGEMRLGSRRVPVVCVSPTAAKLEEDGTEEPVEKVEAVRIWVTDDPLRLPVEVSARAFIGRVFMSLRETEPPLEEVYAALEAGSPLIAGAKETGAAAAGKEEG